MSLHLKIQQLVLTVILLHNLVSKNQFYKFAHFCTMNKQACRSVGIVLDDLDQAI